MTSLNKRRKSKLRSKRTGANDRYYLGSKHKEHRYGMFNSSIRMKNKDFTKYCEDLI